MTSDTLHAQQLASGLEMISIKEEKITHSITHEIIKEAQFINH